MAKCKHGLDSRFCGACANPNRSRAAKRLLVQQRAASHNPPTAVEREAYEAVYAYEEAATQLNRRTTRATRTWPVIAKKGVIAAIDGIVTRKTETPAYRMLATMGMEDMSFEAVVLRHTEAFTTKAIVASTARLSTR